MVPMLVGLLFKFVTTTFNPLVLLLLPLILMIIKIYTVLNVARSLVYEIGKELYWPMKEAYHTVSNLSLRSKTSFLMPSG